MIDEILADLDAAGQKAHDALRRELSKLRTGRAHPAMLDTVRVDYYGQSTPINQLATVAVPEPRLLTVKVWEKSQAQAVDKAIRESDMGLNPQLDGELIRVPVPALSEERRKDLVKIAKKNGEDCKVSIRRARHEALDMLTELKQSGDASEDEVERAKKRAEDVVGQAVSVVDHIVQKKEKEILAV